MPAAAGGEAGKIGGQAAPSAAGGASNTNAGSDQASSGGSGHAATAAASSGAASGSGGTTRSRTACINCGWNLLPYALEARSKSYDAFSPIPYLATAAQGRGIRGSVASGCAREKCHSAFAKAGDPCQTNTVAIGIANALLPPSLLIWTSSWMT